MRQFRPQIQGFFEINRQNPYASKDTVPAKVWHERKRRGPKPRNKVNLNSLT